MNWKSVPAALLAAVLGLGAIAPAAAADDRRGHLPTNGPIAFGRVDPALDVFDLWVSRSNGSGQKRIVEGPTNFSDWSPDGRRIAFDFADETGVHIATIAADGSDRRVLTHAEGVQEAPDWSPDGQWIAYNQIMSFDPFLVSIWIMRSDGSAARQITNGAIDVEPVFSPDGARVAFGRIAGDSPAGQLESVHVVKTDGTGLREVVPARAGLEHPDWSPTGRSIVFNIAPEAPQAPDTGAILTVRPNGQGLRVLLRPTDDLLFFKPVWSPDGRRLLTGCYEVKAELERLCTVSKNGSAEVVVGGETKVNFPSWGPRPVRDR